jgi:TfoX/Sxy family transcriptional regulator of competence genes
VKLQVSMEPGYRGGSQLKWEKPSIETIERFERILPDTSSVEKRKMFGFPCSFINGNMFMGVHQNDIFIRLSHPDREELLKIGQAHQFEPMPGRAMKEYVVIPPPLLDEPGQLEEWIAKSLAYVAALPPKAKKKKS